MEMKEIYNRFKENNSILDELSKEKLRELSTYANQQKLAANRLFYGHVDALTKKYESIGGFRIKILPLEAKEASNLYEAQAKECDFIISKIAEKIEGPTVDYIADFAADYAEDAEYSEEAVYTYITEWDSRVGISSRRAKAKKAAKKICAELEQIASDGTFSNWEKKWILFHNSRTEK